MLEEYESRIGLTPFKNNLEVTRLLKLTEQELKAMSDEDCGLGAFILSQEVYHIQKEINKQRTRVSFCNSKINEIAARTIDQVNQYVPFEIKRMMIIQNNDYARKLYRLEYNAKLCLERLSDIPWTIKDMAAKLAELQQSKRGAKWQR